MKILSLTQGHTDNLGDKAIQKVICSYYERCGHTVICAQFYPEKERDISAKREEELCHTDSIVQASLLRKYLKKLKPLYLLYRKGIDLRGTQLVKQKLKKYWKKFEGEDFDLILIGGGQLIKHNHDFMACMDFWTKRKGIPKIVLGVGGDADLNAREKIIYARAVKHCKKILVRDVMTFQFLKSWKSETELMPDAAFIYSYLFTRKMQLKEDYILIEMYEYSLESDKSRDEYYQEWADKVYEMMYPGEKLMIAYTTYGDYLEGKRFECYMEQTGLVKCQMLETDTLEELIDAVSCARIVYSARMHMLILALNYDKRIEVYPISDKLRIFKEMYANMNDLNVLQDKVLSALRNVLFLNND